MQKWEYKVTRAHTSEAGNLQDVSLGLNIDASLPANKTGLDFTFAAINAATAEEGEIDPKYLEDQELLELDPTWELVSVTPEKMFFGGREKDHLGNDLNGKIEHLETTFYICWWKRPRID